MVSPLSTHLFFLSSSTYITGLRRPGKIWHLDQVRPALRRLPAEGARNSVMTLEVVFCVQTQQDSRNDNMNGSDRETLPSLWVPLIRTKI